MDCQTVNSYFLNNSSKGYSVEIKHCLRKSYSEYLPEDNSWCVYMFEYA